MSCTKIDSQKIIAGYKDYLQMDVGAYFEGTQAIDLCDSNHIYDYRYYTPLSIAGDAAFYKQLQKEESYYKDDKWEYRKVLKLLEAPARVLEVGCGKGAFLKLLRQRGMEGIGLELNDACVSEGAATGLPILNELVEDHAIHHAEAYDAVVAFQVLEHIPEPVPFIEFCLKCLKPGGRLVMAVPNNDVLVFSYKKAVSIRYAQQQRGILKNMPPHHMGLWNRRSLTSLGKLFKLEDENFYNEPVNNEKSGLVAEIFITKYFDLGPLVIKKFLIRIIQKLLITFSVKQGDTIIAVFRKPL